MKQITIITASLLIGFVVGTYFGSTNTTPQGVVLTSGPRFEEQEEILDSFVSACLKGSAEACANLYTKDTVYMIPETPILEGRQAVLGSYKEFFEGRDYKVLEMSEPATEVVHFGDWAAIRGTGKEITESKDGQRSTKTYKWMILSQKQDDGSWKMKWDIFNFDNPLE